jgi:VCBS repeat-containing protein
VTNGAPTAASDQYATDEDAPLTVTAAQGVLSNDTDPDGDALTAAIASQPANGTVTLNSNGSFTYTPNANANGNDSFTYRANDGQANSGAATVTITVNPVNDPPSFTAGGDQSTSAAASNATGETVAGWATGISAGPGNESGQTVSFQVTTNNDAAFAAPPAVDATGTLTYRPNLTATTVAVTVTVVAEDSGGAQSGAQSFTITINP